VPDLASPSGPMPVLIDAAKSPGALQVWLLPLVTPMPGLRAYTVGRKFPGWPSVCPNNSVAPCRTSSQRFAAPRCWPARPRQTATRCDGMRQGATVGTTLVMRRSGVRFSSQARQPVGAFVVPSAESPGSSQGETRHRIVIAHSLPFADGRPRWCQAVDQPLRTASVRRASPLGRSGG
jgi:hypothetical protein